MADRIYAYIDGESHYIRTERAWCVLHGSDASLDCLRYKGQADDRMVLVVPKATVFWTRKLGAGVTRSVYFTSAVTNDQEMHQIRVALRDFELDPHVVLERKQAAERRKNKLRDAGVIEKPKGVDIALAVRMLEDAHKQTTFDRCHLFTSDADFLPVIRAVMAQGKQVYVFGYKDSLRAFLSDTAPHVRAMGVVCDLPGGELRRQQWRKVLKTTVEAFEAMAARVMPILPTQTTPLEVEVAAAAARGEGLYGTGMSFGLLLAILAKTQMLYDDIFEEEEPALRRRLGELEAEHTKITATWADLPTQRSKDKAKARLVQVEAEMSEIEGKLVNAVDAFVTANEEFRRMAKAWEEAAAAMESEVRDRRRAEAIRRVIARITIYWRTTKRPGKRDVREAQDFDIEPVPGGKPRKVSAFLDCRNEGTLLPTTHSHLES